MSTLSSVLVKLGFGPELAGLAAGYYPGKNVAGEVAAATAPKGRVTRSENIARQLAIGAAPLGGLAGLAVAKKYNLAGHVGRLAANHLDLNTIRQLQQYGAPLAAGVGGSIAGGALSGLGVGAIQQLRGPVRKSKIDEASKVAMLDELRALGAATEGQLKKLAAELTPDQAQESAKRLRGLEESAPSPAKMLRGAAVGAVVQPLASLAFRAAAGPEFRMGKNINLGRRVNMANAVQGAIFGSLVPAGQHKLETEVEKQKLREYLGTHQRGTVRGQIRKMTGL